MKFSKILCVILVSFFTVLSASKPIYVNAEEISPTAWPGRPGRNGDGSEEWLQGSYGQTNGPWKLIYTSKGSVNALNTQKSVADTIGLGIVGALSGNILAGTKALVVSGLVTATGVATTVYGGYEGVYYISKTYISGRCMKTVITTYRNSNYTGFVKQYEKYTKW